MFGIWKQSKWHVGIAAALIAMLGALRPMLADAPTSTDQRSLYVDVEQGNRLIRGLREGNFRLYEDGQLQSFQLKQPQRTATVALLVEYSESSWVYFNDIDEAISGFVHSFATGNWYALATFANSMKVQVDFTKSVGEIVSTYESLGEPGWNEVDTYDAVYAMLDKMARLPGRRVLVVIGSGLDTFSHHTIEDVQKKAREANVVIYGVGLGSDLRGMYEPYLNDMQQLDLTQARAFLGMLADETGGQAWFPTVTSAYPDVMKAVVQDMENQYRLVYTPDTPEETEFHKVKVKAFAMQDGELKQFKVRVRKGWLEE